MHRSRLHSRQPVAPLCNPVRVVRFAARPFMGGFASVVLWQSRAFAPHSLLTRKGNLSVPKTKTDTRRSRCFQVGPSSFILPGELIGADFLGGSENHFAVRALTDIQLCEFDPEQLVSLLTKTHDTTMHMLAVLGHHCKDLEETIYSLGKCSAMERMANLIVGLRARIAASEGSGALQFDLPLRRYDFADALGLTPVHVSRTFAQLKSNRVLEFRSGILQILNEARLLELASALYRSRAPMNADAANEAAASSGL
jgi:CRP-like cAMP-binding protein